MKEISEISGMNEILKSVINEKKWNEDEREGKKLSVLKNKKEAEKILKEFIIYINKEKIKQFGVSEEEKKW